MSMKNRPISRKTSQAIGDHPLPDLPPGPAASDGRPRTWERMNYKEFTFLETGNYSIPRCFFLGSTKMHPDFISINSHSTASRLYASNASCLANRLPLPGLSRSQQRSCPGRRLISFTTHCRDQQHFALENAAVRGCWVETEAKSVAPKVYKDLDKGSKSLVWTWFSGCVDDVGSFNY